MKVDEEGLENVLVTGGTGMIGSNVVRELVKDGKYRVFVLVRWRSNLRNLASVIDSIERVHGDLTDTNRIRDLVNQIKPKKIFHFGAQAINNAGFDAPGETLQSNVLGTVNLLEAVRANGLTEHCKILVAGSSTEYGKTGDMWDGPIPETAPLMPVSPYGVSKQTTESLARQYYLAHGLETVTARIFIHVAPGGTEHLAVQQFAKQIALIERGIQKPELQHGWLGALRDMTDVRDSAPVYVALLEKGKPGEAYNVGSNMTYSTQFILDEALKQAKVNITAKKDPARVRPFDEKVLSADISKLRALTGWTPNPDMKKTIGEVLDYWRNEVAMLYPDKSSSKPEFHKLPRKVIMNDQ